jgi:hypothetical protein
MGDGCLGRDKPPCWPCTKVGVPESGLFARMFNVLALDESRLA